MQKLQQEKCKHIKKFMPEKYDEKTYSMCMDCGSLLEMWSKRDVEMYTAGLKRAIEVLPMVSPVIDIPDYDSDERGFDKCRQESITNITKEMM